MRSNRWIIVLCIAASFFVVLTATVPAQAPLTGAFTYQGQLKQNGQPFNGSANLIFGLYDASSGGNLLGSQTVNSVSVSNGLFAAVLNAGGQLGANAFNGARRWLSITVNGTALSPRQEVTAAPYALFAAKPWATNGSAISYTGGNVGIGTTTPGKALTIAGDAELGTSSGDYRHLRIGGGNSDGFIYGSFPKYADGIHLGYNYYANSAGADVVIHPDGGTSRLTAGYGSIALATGPADGTPPTNRLVVEQNGNVRLGTNTQLYAPGGEENLRLIRGVVNASGGIITGSGFSITRTDVGHYTVYFNTPFSGGAPSVTATANGRLLAITFGVTASYANIIIEQVDTSGYFDAAFHFIAVGPR